MFLPIILSSMLSVASAAPTERHTTGLRAGLCAGLSTECVLGAIKVEYAGKFVGANVGLGLAPTANLKLYPQPFKERTGFDWRPYVYGGSGLVLFAGFIHGAGFGADIHPKRWQRVLIQPSVGVNYTPDIQAATPAAAVSLSMGF